MLLFFSDLVPVSGTYLSQETLYRSESVKRRLRRTTPCGPPGMATQVLPACRRRFLYSSIACRSISNLNENYHHKQHHYNLGSKSQQSLTPARQCLLRSYTVVIVNLGVMISIFISGQKVSLTLTSAFPNKTANPPIKYTKHKKKVYTYLIQSYLRKYFFYGNTFHITYLSILFSIDRCN